MAPSTEFRYWIGDPAPYARLKALAAEVEPKRVRVSICSSSPLLSAARVELLAEFTTRKLREMVQLCESRGYGPEIAWSGQQRVAELTVHCRCRAHFVKRPP